MTENTTENSILSDADCAADNPEFIMETQFPDYQSAMASVTFGEKRTAFIMLLAAGITLGVLFLSRFFWLFKPLFDLVYYGTLPIVLYYITLLVVFTAFVVLLNIYLKRHCGVRLFAPQKKQMDVPRTLAVIAIGAAAMFFISLGFKFKVKVQVEMGSGVTMATALINLAIYIYYALHLWLGLIAAALVQRALTILIPTKYSVPWGAILLVTVFGLIEFALEFGTTTHMYSWLYYLLTFAYAAVYELTGRSFHLTFWACVIIMVL